MKRKPIIAEKSIPARHDGGVYRCTITVIRGRLTATLPMADGGNYLYNLHLKSSLSKRELKRLARDPKKYRAIARTAIESCDYLGLIPFLRRLA